MVSKEKVGAGELMVLGFFLILWGNAVGDKGKFIRERSQEEKFSY